MKQQLAIYFCAVIFFGAILSGCSLLPNSTQLPRQNTSKPTLTGTVQITTAADASYSAGLNLAVKQDVVLSGMAIRLLLPKIIVPDGTEPFIVTPEVRDKFWQPLINSLDCETDETHCFADLALITLSPEGSDFQNLDTIAGLNPTVFTAETMGSIILDDQNSLATTKAADSIALDFENQVPTQ